ncbi:hypothetical protein ACFWCA_36030 [Streptomyces phaeochromogenes]|uniref:hypothetical protein n=1 Tax=Streptomyces phaeochromogenes TaxID=1923 RepID=UPI003694D8F6
MTEKNELDERFPRYSRVQCIVTAHRSYGLIVEVERTVPGFVDLADISSPPVTAADWPDVGAERQTLVLGATNDGRLRLDMRQDDLQLADSAVDLPGAMARWSEARRAHPDDTGPRQSFYQSPDAALLLNWLIAGKGRGSPVESVLELISDAPLEVRQTIVTEQTGRALHGDPNATSIIAALSQACGMDVSTEVLKQLLTEQPPSAEHLAGLADALTGHPLTEPLRRWALASPNPEIRDIGAGIADGHSG